MNANTNNYTWATIQEKLGLQTAKSSAGNSRNLTRPAVPVLTLQELMQQSCIDGERTNHLTKLAGALIASGFNLDECIDHCRCWNQGNPQPLDDDKIVGTCTSISATDQRNHPERYPELLQDTPLFALQDGRIDHYLVTPPPLRRWLLKDLVVLGKVGAVVAPGGSSKSQWLLQLAVSVTTGIPLAGCWEVGETGGALVFFAEDDHDEIHRRLHRTKNQLQITGHGSELSVLPERLFIFSTIGTETLLTKKGSSGEVSATVIVDRIASLAKQIPDLRLIVIDPASRFRGGEENSNEDATRFVEALEKLAQKTGASVLVAHHTNKGSYTSTDAGQGASRGASALTDGLRWQMNLNRPTDGQATAFGLHKENISSYVAATVTKTNYSAPPAPILLERCEGGYLSAVSPIQAKRDSEQKAIVKIMHIIAEQRKPISARNLEERHGGIQGPLKMSKQRLRDMIKLGAERGYLEGSERKPLTLTAIGSDLLKCMPAPAADAPHGPQITPRKKQQ